MGDVDEFFAHEDNKHSDPEAQKVTKKSKSKRKRTDAGTAAPEAKVEENEEANALRKRARYFCTSPEQWRCVSKYGDQKIETWVQDQEFQQKKQFQKSVMDGAHRVVATIVDKVSAGDGHVKEQILADESLRQAIHEEGSEWVSFLNNKIKGVILLAIDIVNGKSDQLRARPSRDSAVDSSVRIEEEAPNGSDAGGGQEEEAQEAETELALSRPDLR